MQLKTARPRAARMDPGLGSGSLGGHGRHGSDQSEPGTPI